MLHLFVKIERRVICTELFRCLFENNLFAIDVESFRFQHVCNLQCGYRAKDLSALTRFGFDLNCQIADLLGDRLSVLLDLGSLVSGLTCVFSDQLLLESFAMSATPFGIR